jgi:hypothetical protein
MSKKLPESEWSHVMRADSVPSAGKHAKLSASPEQCAAIARRVGVGDIENLHATMKLALQNGGHILYIQGAVEADIEQACVVSGTPVKSHVKEEFEAWYADHDKAIPFNRAKHEVKAKMEGDEVQILDERDDPETMIDGQVDLGEVAIQYLSLGINPYPRAPEFAANDIEESAPQSKQLAAASSGSGSLRPNPFAALKNWRPKD